MTSPVYIEPEVPRALKIQAVETSRSISEPVNRAVPDTLREDREDLMVFDERASEPTVSLGDMVKQMDIDGDV